MRGREGWRKGEKKGKKGSQTVKEAWNSKELRNTGWQRQGKDEEGYSWRAGQ